MRKSGLSFSTKLLFWLLSSQLLLWGTSFPLFFNGLSEVLQTEESTNLQQKIAQTWMAAKDLELNNPELRENPEWKSLTLSLGEVRGSSQSEQTFSNDIFIQALRNFLSFALLQILAFLALAVWAARSLSHQLRNVDRFLNRVRRGETQLRLPPQKGKEFIHLGEEINRLLDTFEQNEARLSEQGKLLGWRDTAQFLSHQIKNPLTALSLALRNLEIMECFATDLAQENADIIKTESQRLNTLVNRLKNLTAFTELNLQRIKLGDLVKNLADNFTQGKLDLQWNISEDFYIHGDTVLLEQAFTNFFNNSWEASPNGHVAITVESNQRTLHLKDSNEGLTQEIFNKLFTPPFTTKSQGTGLGLSFCRKIITLHGGKLDSLLSPTGGLEFLIKFPELENA